MKHKNLEVKFLKLTGTKGFSILAGINRPIDPSQVTKLSKSIDKMGVVRPVLVAELNFITGIPEIFVIDGQHLYNACIRTGCDIPYSVVTTISNKTELVEHLALLNNSSKSWTMKDYVTVWLSIYDDYKVLNKYYAIYDIEMLQLAEILMYNNTTSTFNKGCISKAVKTGAFKVQNEAYCVELLNNITDALKIVPRMDRFSNKLFISTYVNHMNNCVGYSHSRFLKNLKINKDKFKLSTQDPEEFSKLIKSIM
jgi:hypothetical protein